MGPEEMRTIARLIVRVLSNADDELVLREARQEVLALPGVPVPAWRRSAPVETRNGRQCGGPLQLWGCSMARALRVAVQWYALSGWSSVQSSTPSAFQP